MKPRDFACRVARKVIYPLLPQTARLPFNYWLHVAAGSVEPELRHIQSICKQRNVAIDVGANIGLYSYRLAQIFPKVYAFEINEGVAADLVSYHARNITVIHLGLSSEHRDVTLYIPVANGIQLNGWASLLPDNCPDTQTHITKSVHVQPLDSYSLSNVSFIKIDVEGHEVEVLRGAVETISAGQPVVLVEVKEQNWERVSSFFETAGYEEVSLKSLANVDGAAENHIFVPRAKCHKAS